MPIYRGVPASRGEKLLPKQRLYCSTLQIQALIARMSWMIQLIKQQEIFDLFELYIDFYNFL